MDIPVAIGHESKIFYLLFGIYLSKRFIQQVHLQRLQTLKTKT